MRHETPTATKVKDMAGKEKPLTPPAELSKRVDEIKRERDEQDKEWRATMEENPRGILPSPEKEKPLTSAELEWREYEIVRERDEQDKEFYASMEENPRGIQPSPEKEKPLTPAELAEREYEIEGERDEQDKESLDSMVKHARCGILPSPDLLRTCLWEGLDQTKTIEDFKEMVKWFKEAKVLNTDFCKYFKGSGLDEANYNGLIHLAFSNAFAAMRHTGHPEHHELVIWYYTGHGLPNDKLSDARSMPELSEVNFNEEYNEIAKQYINEDQKVKGGELVLHHVGYCGLQGLLKPWIACVKDESRNAKGNGKKNKHLLIILDSCHSGILAEELEELNKKNGPWNEEGCTVTLQAACGPDEGTFGGYFTPVFKFFSENQKHLKDRLEEWEGMDEEKKEHFRRIKLPSPKLVTTRSLTEGEKRMPVLHREIQNFKFVLFQDPGFFKFCAIQQFQITEDHDALLSKRVLNSANDFMNSPTFNVIDYKLMKMTQGHYVDAPMGLFLLKDPSNPTKYAVCAHIHFENNDTSKVGRINLVHHKVPPVGSILYIEDHDGLSNTQIKKSRHKIPYAMVPACVNANKKDPSHWSCWDWKTGNPVNSLFLSKEIEAEINNAKRLLKACHDFVEAKERNRWADVGRWNMTSMDLGVVGLFRKKQRSAWMDQYLETYGCTFQDHSDTTSTTG